MAKVFSPIQDPHVVVDFRLQDPAILSLLSMANWRIDMGNYRKTY